MSPAAQSVPVFLVDDSTVFTYHLGKEMTVFFPIHDSLVSGDAR